MIVTTSPQAVPLKGNITEGIKVFLGGGISNCADWQSKFIALFGEDDRINFFNPRREDFDITNPRMSEEQIKWEHIALQSADVILFWFAPETMCPITLFELGKYVYKGTFPDRHYVIVGCDPNYMRKFDVEYQLSLDTNIKVATSLEQLAEHLKQLLKTPFCQ